MKKTSKFCVGAFGLTTLLITTAFTVKNSGDEIISSSSSKEKSSGGIIGRTRSAHDNAANSNSIKTCTQCHSGGATTPTPSAIFSPELGTNNTYVPGTVYTISYTVTGYPKFGFGLEINDGNTATSMTAGTISANSSNIIYDPAPVMSANTIPGTIKHNAPILTGSSAIITWTAPSNGTTAYLFSTALGVNGTGSTSGDNEAFYDLILTPKVTGIEETISVSNLKLFPNPATEIATFTYSLKTESYVTIDITDLNGRLVSKEVDETLSTGNHSQKLNVSNLDKGTYLVRIKSNDKIVTKKLSVN